MTQDFAVALGKIHGSQDGNGRNARFGDVRHEDGQTFPGRLLDFGGGPGGAQVFDHNYSMKMTPFGKLAIADIGDAFIPSAFDLQEVADQSFVFFSRIIDRGITPIIAGGDHSITYPILKALGRKEPLGLIHIDSHFDMAESLNGSNLHHGSMYVNGIKEGFLDPKRIVQIGIRDPFAPMETFGHGFGVTTIDIDRFYDLGPDAVAAEARRIVGDGPTYISSTSMPSTRPSLPARERPLSGGSAPTKPNASCTVCVG